MNFYDDALREGIEFWVDVLASLEPEPTRADKDAIRAEFDAIWAQTDPAAKEMMLANFEQVHGEQETMKQGLQRTRRVNNATTR